MKTRTLAAWCVLAAAALGQTVEWKGHHILDTTKSPNAVLHGGARVGVTLIPYYTFHNREITACRRGFHTGRRVRLVAWTRSAG